MAYKILRNNKILHETRHSAGGTKARRRRKAPSGPGAHQVSVYSAMLPGKTITSGTSAYVEE